MKNNSLYAEADASEQETKKQETPTILNKEQFKGVSSFDIKNMKPKTIFTSDIVEQLNSIVIPKQLEKDKEHWLTIMGKWLLNNIAIPIIQSSLQEFANGVANGKHKKFDINKISSFKSFKNYLKDNG